MARTGCCWRSHSRRPGERDARQAQKLRPVRPKLLRRRKVEGITHLYRRRTADYAAPIRRTAQKINPNEIKMKNLLAAVVLFASVAHANAECVCQCVDGRMQPLCQNSIDLPPLCPPTICPITSPSIAPINPAILPPLGTSQCHQARACGTFGNCQWQQICR